jgi:uncharacterized protein
VDSDRPTSTAEPTSPVVELTTEGLVLGSHDAMPLEFWVGVEEGRQLELDDLLIVETVSPRGQTVRFFGIVDAVRKRYEGAQYDTDAFRASEGTLPVDVSYTAHVQVTRIDPEVFIPPHPGDRARLVQGEEFRARSTSTRCSTACRSALLGRGSQYMPTWSFSMELAERMRR